MKEKQACTVTGTQLSCRGLNKSEIVILGIVEKITI